mmetsp:Transcript_33460/g.52319  ORF Transcript_33460/g.52319 Transcript_33460/m.52319 type:complete len:274 (+) Transcript_33460:468-1289(+)
MAMCFGLMFWDKAATRSAVSLKSSVNRSLSITWEKFAQISTASATGAHATVSSARVYSKSWKSLISFAISAFMSGNFRPHLTSILTHRLTVGAVSVLTFFVAFDISVLRRCETSSRLASSRTLRRIRFKSSAERLSSSDLASVIKQECSRGCLMPNVWKLRATRTSSLALSFGAALMIGHNKLAKMLTIGTELILLQIFRISLSSLGFQCEHLVFQKLHSRKSYRGVRSIADFLFPSVGVGRLDVWKIPCKIRATVFASMGSFRMADLSPAWI